MFKLLAAIATMPTSGIPVVRVLWSMNDEARWVELEVSTDGDADAHGPMPDDSDDVDRVEQAAMDVYTVACDDGCAAEGGLTRFYEPMSAAEKAVFDGRPAPSSDREADLRAAREAAETVPALLGMSSAATRARRKGVSAAPDIAKMVQRGYRTRSGRLSA